MSKVSPRSVYVAQLRRAFLMRAHPDRFRNHSSKIRRGQANLLAALSERMTGQDFQDYTTTTTTTSSNLGIINHHSSSHNNYPEKMKKNNKQIIPYVLEKRDGSLIQQNLRLDDPVDVILKSLVDALQLSGAASLASPPPPPTPNTDGPRMAHHHAGGSATSHANTTDPTARFDINTLRGRDLDSFLRSIFQGEDDGNASSKSSSTSTSTSTRRGSSTSTSTSSTKRPLNTNLMEERRASRMDASAAALVARRLYSFQAIDGIGLGWSSASFAKLLRSLIQLHEEHHSRFHVSSFYPLRLVVAPEHDNNTNNTTTAAQAATPTPTPTSITLNALDVYGGTIHLRPAATQLEWLESLREVTEERLEEFRLNRQLLEDRTSLIQNELGVKLQKGHSCSSKEYHHFLERMATQIISVDNDVDSRSTNSSSSISICNKALELDRLRVVVESPIACRRARVTPEGSIRVHSNMSDMAVLAHTASKLSASARERWIQEQEEREECQEAVVQIQWVLGLQKVYRTTNTGRIVRHVEFKNALSRLMEQSEKLRNLNWLSGCSLGIAGSGQFCHLGDDGSLIIPHDWK